jgi:hypothetical protein
MKLYFHSQEIFVTEEPTVTEETFPPGMGGGKRGIFKGMEEKLRSG